jgi:hypothetical protein
VEKTKNTLLNCVFWKFCPLEGLGSGKPRVTPTKTVYLGAGHTKTGYIERAIGTDWGRLEWIGGHWNALGANRMDWDPADALKL